MKVLYLADNSDLLNWGCRATSLSLRQLIARNHEIVGRVTGGMIQSQYPLSDRIGDVAYQRLSRLFNRGKVRGLPVAGPVIGKVMDGLGVRNALTHDLDANIRTLERARAYSPDTRRLFDELAACEAVVVNGEGDLIFSTPARARLLYTLTVCALGLRMGKGLYYLNAMASECPASGINRETLALAAGVLSQAQAFTVRDPGSEAFVRANMPGLRAAMYPDAVFAWSRMFAGVDPAARYDASALIPAFERTGAAMPEILNRPYAVLGGGSRAAHDWPRATESYVGLVREMQALGMPILLAPGCDGDLFLREVSRRTGAPMLPLEAPMLAVAAVLANARVFVSGRWHPSILASLGGTPCVFFGSNSHKTLSIQHLLEYPDPHEYGAIPTPAEAKAATAEASALVDQGGALRTRIAQTAARLGAEAERMAAVIGPASTPPLRARAG